MHKRCIHPKISPIRHATSNGLMLVRQLAMHAQHKDLTPKGAACQNLTF